MFEKIQKVVARLLPISTPGNTPAAEPVSEPQDDFNVPLVDLEKVLIGHKRSNNLDHIPIPNEFTFECIVCRCIWNEVEGSKVERGGTTYAMTEKYLGEYIRLFQDAIDPVRPLLKNEVVKTEMIKVKRGLFDEIITNTSGIVHVNRGLHRDDYEA
jgi:hypothetical protein